MAHNNFRNASRGLSGAGAQDPFADLSRSNHAPANLGLDEKEKTLLRMQGRFRHNEMLRQEMLMRKARKGMEKTGGWTRRVLGIGLQSGGLPGSRLIHPYSPFAQTMMLMSGLLLTYSAIVSSFMVGILWNSDTCDKLLFQELDMFIDCFFMVEIILTFFIGITHHGEYCDDIRVIAPVYLKSTFVFDLVTSLPVSFFEIDSLFVCRGANPEMEAESDNNAFRFVRVIKPLKIARILRTLKLMKMLKIFSVVGDYFRIPPFLARSMKIIVFILLLVHAASCMFWLIKEVSNTPENMQRFLTTQGFPGDTAENTANPYQKYVIAFYFVNTVFCTIGFGDIAGMNTAERLYCVFLFYLGVLVFGSLLAEVQDTVNKMNGESRARENRINTMVDFLRQEEVPMALEKRLVNWADFNLRCMQKTMAKQSVMDMVPEYIQRPLAAHLHHGLLLSIPLFRDITDMCRDDFVLDLWQMLLPQTFSPFVSIATSDPRTGQANDRMYVIVVGTAILQEQGNIVATYHPGDYFGEYALLGSDLNEDLGESSTVQASIDEASEAHAYHGKRTESQLLAISNVLAFYIDRTMFREVLATYPASVRTELIEYRNQRVEEYGEDFDSIFRQEKMKCEERMRRGSSNHSANDTPKQAEAKGKHALARARWHELTRQVLRKMEQRYKELHPNGPPNMDGVYILQRAARRLMRTEHSGQSSVNDSEEGFIEELREPPLMHPHLIARRHSDSPVAARYDSPICTERRKIAPIAEASVDPPLLEELGSFLDSTAHLPNSRPQSPEHARPISLTSPQSPVHSRPISRTSSHESLQIGLRNLPAPASGGSLRERRHSQASWSPAIGGNLLAPTEPVGDFSGRGNHATISASRSSSVGRHHLLMARHAGSGSPGGSSVPVHGSSSPVRLPFDRDGAESVGSGPVVNLSRRPSGFSLGSVGAASGGGGGSGGAVLGSGVGMRSSLDRIRGAIAFSSPRRSLGAGVGSGGGGGGSGLGGRVFEELRDHGPSSPLARVAASELSPSRSFGTSGFQRTQHEVDFQQQVDNAFNAFPRNRSSPKSSAFLERFRGSPKALRSPKGRRSSPEALGRGNHAALFSAMSLLGAGGEEDSPTAAAALLRRGMQASQGPARLGRSSDEFSGGRSGWRGDGYREDALDAPTSDELQQIHLAEKDDLHQLIDKMDTRLGECLDKQEQHHAANADALRTQGERIEELHSAMEKMTSLVYNLSQTLGASQTEEV